MSFISVNGSEGVKIQVGDMENIIGNTTKRHFLPIIYTEIKLSKFPKQRKMGSHHHST